MWPNRIVNQYDLQDGIAALLEWDSELFSELNLPEGVDPELVIGTILSHSGKTPLMHPDPNYMKYYIGLWSIIRKPIWGKLMATMNLEYNPIHNYDRTEEGEDTTDDSRTINRDVTSNSERQNTSETTSTDTTTDNNNHSVSAYNSSEYQPDNKDERTVNGNGNANTEISDTVDSTTADNTKDDLTREYKHKLRAYGNIGVTTTQQMIREERDVVNYNIYDVIADDFVEEFCLYVW